MLNNEQNVQVSDTTKYNHSIQFITTRQKIVFLSPHSQRQDERYKILQMQKIIQLSKVSFGAEILIT